MLLGPRHRPLSPNDIFWLKMYTIACRYGANHRWESPRLFRTEACLLHHMAARGTETAGTRTGNGYNVFGNFRGRAGFFRLAFRHVFLPE